MGNTQSMSDVELIDFYNQLFMNVSLHELIILMFYKIIVFESLDQIFISTIQYQLKNKLKNKLFFILSSPDSKKKFAIQLLLQLQKIQKQYETDLQNNNNNMIYTDYYNSQKLINDYSYDILLLDKLIK